MCLDMKNWFSSVGTVFARTFRLIFKDQGAMLFFIFLPLVYPVIYTLIYNPELVRDVPIAVVDNSRTAASREFMRVTSGAPVISIYDYVPDMAEAKRLMAEHKVFGVMLIPENFGKDLGNGVPAHVTFYSDMSLFLRYRAFIADMSDVQMEMTNRITHMKAEELGLDSMLAGDSALPVNSESNFLGDTDQGFASFVIPGIVVMILQQSMLLGICLLGGTSRERRRKNGGLDPLEPDSEPASAVVWGKTLCFTVFYIAFTIYNLRIVPEMFSLPHYGSAADYLLYIFPMLLATAFLGQGLVVLMKDREAPFRLIVVSSVVFLFLSGLIWPRYAMSKLWYWLGNFVPATWGIEGFVRINANSATLAENSTQYLAMWGLTALYMVFAWWTTSYLRTRPVRRRDTAG